MHSNNNHHHRSSLGQSTHFHLAMIIIIWNLCFLWTCIHTVLAVCCFRFCIWLKVFMSSDLILKLDVAFAVGYKTSEATLFNDRQFSPRRIASEMKFSLARFRVLFSRAMKSHTNRNILQMERERERGNNRWQFSDLQLNAINFTQKYDLLTFIGNNTRNDDSVVRKMKSFNWLR